jgi:hypothetical protein
LAYGGGGLALLECELRFLFMQGGIADEVEHKNHWDFSPAIMPHILQEIVGKFESALVPAKL